MAGKPSFIYSLYVSVGSLSKYKRKYAAINNIFFIYK
jgi:hypothetical protein